MTLQESFASFKAQRPDWLKYETRPNLEKIQALAATITPDLSTATCWIRAFDALVKEKKLVAIPGWKAPLVPASREFRLRVQAMSNEELRQLYRDDPAFHEELDRLWPEEGSTSREVPTAEADDYRDFGANDWRKLPPETLARLMSKPAFRKRIDELIADGAI